MAVFVHQPCGLLLRYSLPRKQRFDNDVGTQSSLYPLSRATTLHNLFADRDVTLRTPSNRASLNLSSTSDRASLNLSNFDRGVLPDQEREVFKNPLFGLDEDEEGEGEELDHDEQVPQDTQGADGKPGENAFWWG